MQQHSSWDIFQSSIRKKLVISSKLGRQSTDLLSLTFCNLGAVFYCNKRGSSVFNNYLKIEASGCWELSCCKEIKSILDAATKSARIILNLNIKSLTIIKVYICTHSIELEPCIQTFNVLFFNTCYCHVYFQYSPIDIL